MTLQNEGYFLGGHPVQHYYFYNHSLQIRILSDICSTQPCRTPDIKAGSNIGTSYTSDGVARRWVCLKCDKCGMMGLNTVTQGSSCPPVLGTRSPHVVHTIYSVIIPSCCKYEQLFLTVPRLCGAPDCYLEPVISDIIHHNTETLLLA